MTKLYAVRDVKADAFSSLMPIATEGLAIRSFAEACKDRNSDLNKYPEDYMLYEIGTWEANTGAVSSCLPKFIASASAFVNRPETPVVENPHVEAK